MKYSNLQTVSLFSGCGGLDLGFMKLGFEIIWGNDNDCYSATIHKNNFNVNNFYKFVTEDIRNIPSNEIPDCEVLLAGFPCASYSSAGNRKGVNEERGLLFKEALRVVEDKKPKIVVFENVRGIMSIKVSKKTSLIEHISNELSKTSPGYNVNYKLLNASKYGVPQNRHRVILVAIRSDLNLDYTFPLPSHDNKLPNPELTVGNVINVPKGTPNQDEVLELPPQAKNLVPYIKEGGSWKDIPYEILPERFRKIRDDMKKYKAPNFYRRFSRDEINGTITATATPENCGILHPVENRRYTVREVARFQSFPDDFIFPGQSLRAKYRIIGNAVPPKLAEVIASSILKQLNECEGDKLNSIKVDDYGQLAFEI